MIGVHHINPNIVARRFCCEPLENVENYHEAVSDPTTVWTLHHRDEIRTLPSGMVVRRSMRELMEMGRYYDCPANELIFMRTSDHIKLHRSGFKRPGVGGHKPGTPCGNREWLTGRHWKIINGRRTWLPKEN